MTCLEAALKFESDGYSVIPIEANGKTPLVKWVEFQSRRASPEEIKAWFKRWPKANLAIVTGSISGIMVMDVDVKNGAGGMESLKSFDLPATQCVQTPSGGLHFYFKMAPGIKSVTGLKPGIDIRAEGGCIMAPPSTINGKAYEYLKPIALILDAPEGVKDAFRTTLRASPIVGATIPMNVRNSTLTSLAGKMRHSGMTSDEIESALKDINTRRCEEPLSDREVKDIAQSIGRYPSPHDTPVTRPDVQEVLEMFSLLTIQAETIDRKFAHLMDRKWLQLKKCKPQKAREILSVRDEIDTAYLNWTEGKCGREVIEQGVNRYESLWAAIAKGF